MTIEASVDRDLCLQKLDSAVAVVRRLIDGDHPHRDSHEALEQILSVYSSERRRLTGLDETAQSDTVLEVCRRINIKLARLTIFLGLLLRSTNVRNAFESYFPIRILATQLFTPRARIVVGSEWHFAPYTYPLTLDELQEFIFIGIPASECDNPLILPLAGHELGHVVWRRKGAKTAFDSVIRECVLDLYRKNWNEFSNLFKPQFSPEKLESELFGQLIWGESNVLAQKQLEEIFCDFLGLYIFGRSYLHSFRYLLAPSLGQLRSPSYPPISRRANYLIYQARQYGIEHAADFAEIFSSGEPQLWPDKAFIVKMADSATEQLFTKLSELVEDFRGNAEMFSAGAAMESQAATCLKQLVPPTSVASIPAIVNAAWDIRLDLDSWNILEDVPAPDRRSEKIRVLRDLVLKSFEVYEYGKRRLKYDAKCQGNS